ncbi:nucleolar transcription factor 1-A-like isoform X2 [Penaeus chinensis]|uniref:nucleolar transcription factor 1-A-like isoform X2 n=1 Tax=Penaeus chinensis TaxID=139456 RepID=UPI001FB76EEC|nr:nucleolar transcription factor 1-A-like isoform X2 [Penaeus chinensis]XP_047501755.1 nucleolar transcription factor 1-A-like isoform X2 [Penaeus chinensis]
MGKKSKPSVAPMMEILNEKSKKKKKLDNNLNIENSPVKEDAPLETEESGAEMPAVKKKKKKKHKKEGHDDSLNDSENMTDFQKSPKKRTSSSEVKSPPKKMKKDKSKAAVDEEEEEKEPINSNEAALDLWTTEEKLMLISKMQEKLQPNDKISYRRRIAGSKWNWNDLTFGNKTAKECEEQFLEIIDSINKIKTLEQILTEAEQLTRSGGLRKKNLNAFQYFMRENTQTLKTGGKNENLRGRELFSVLINNWYSLDESEKGRYKTLAKEEASSKEGHPVSSPRLPFEIYYSIESEKIGSKNKQLKAELRTKYNALKKKTKLKYIEESFKEFHKYKIEVAEYLKINPSYKTVKKFPNKEEAELFLINHLKMPREPPYQPSTAYYHQLMEEGKLDDLPGKERLITATRQFANLPLAEQTAITEQTKQRYEEYREQVAQWKEQQDEHIMDIVNRYFPETTKKAKKEKTPKVKTSMNKFENVQVTAMNAPKFSELPKKPPRTGFLLFSAKFEHKMKGKFSDVKERKESCKDYWNKLPEEHKQIYRNRSRELQEEYKSNLLEFVENLEEAERVMYLGHYRKQVRAYFCRDIFEEKYPNKVYPVYISSPKKKVKSTVNGVTVKDEAIDSDEDELPVAKNKTKGKKVEQEIQNALSSSSDDSSDQEEEEESNNEMKETWHQPQMKRQEASDSSESSSDEEVATMQRKTIKSPKQRQQQSNHSEVRASPPKRQTPAKGNTRSNSSEDSSSDESDIIKPSWRTPTQKPSIQRDESSEDFDSDD